MTLAEFLDWDEGTDTRYELVRGKVVALPIPSARHSVILANVGAGLQAKIKGPGYVAMMAGVIRPDRETPSMRPTWWSAARRCKRTR